MVLVAFCLLVSPAVLLGGGGNRNGSTGPSGSAQVSQMPRVDVTILINAGEEDQGFQLLTSQDFQTLQSFLTNLPPAPAPNWNSLGWRGYQLFNVGVAGLPEEVRVFEGVIRTINLGLTQFYIDQRGLESWLTAQAAQQRLTTGLVEQRTSDDESSIVISPLPDDTTPVVVKDLPTSGSEPPYEPDKWNKPDVKNKNNCYNYARNKILEKFGRPGRGTTSEPPFPGEAGYNCAAFVAAAKADGMTAVDCDKACPEGSYKVALVLDPDGSGGKLPPDYHWYRQDKGGKWSHKPGAGEATDKDSSGKPISDPRTADRKRKTKDGWGAGYKDFCGCFCVKAS